MTEPFSPQDQDEAFMRRALELAVHARDHDGEVPVGAVLVLNGEIVGEGWNRNITLADPSAHAEIGALREAGQRVGNHRFPGATLYVTLEPCAMCAMALVHARVARVVYAASDPKTGAAGSVFDTLISERHNHRIDAQGGLLADESAAILRDFFRARRRGSTPAAVTSAASSGSPQDRPSKMQTASPSRKSNWKGSTRT